MNHNIGLARNSGQAMWYVSWGSKDSADGMDDKAKVGTIAHGKWKGERMAFLKVTGKHPISLQVLSKIQYCYWCYLH